jgi:hypothetical protein
MTKAKREAAKRAKRAARATEGTRAAKRGAPIHSGANLRDALEVAKSLGCAIRPMGGTDDAMVTHPGYDGAVQVKVTRKDSTRELTAMLRRVAAGRYAPVA